MLTALFLPRKEYPDGLKSSRCENAFKRQLWKYTLRLKIYGKYSCVILVRAIKVYINVLCPLLIGFTMATKEHFYND